MYVNFTKLKEKYDLLKRQMVAFVNLPPQAVDSVNLSILSSYTMRGIDLPKHYGEEAFELLDEIFGESKPQRQVVNVETRITDNKGDTYTVVKGNVTL